MQTDQGVGGKSRQALDTVVKAQSVQAAVDLLRDVYAMKHVTLHLANTIIGFIDSPFVRSTYPPEWLAQYLLKGYIEIDPVVAAGLTCQLPFFWSDLEMTGDALELMADAQRHGLGQNGYSIPVIDKDMRRSLLSFNSCRSTGEWKRHIQEHASDLAEIAHAMHKKALRETGSESHVSFTPREIECLHWTAQGKDARAIATILMISEHTVRGYLKTIRYKLDCATMAQAVAKAISMRLITP